MIDPYRAAALKAAMCMTTSAVVGIHTAREDEKRSRTIKISAAEGETVNIVTTQTIVTSPNQKGKMMFKNEHARGKSPVRQALKALDKRQQRDAKTAAAQAKRDRKAAKRAAMVSASETSDQRQESADV